MIITTTDSVEGRPVRKHLGVVGGEKVTHARFKWGAEKIRAEFETALGSARAEALERLAASAEALGAQAVVGVTVDWEVLNMILIVHAVGTAVLLA